MGRLGAFQLAVVAAAFAGFFASACSSSDGEPGDLSTSHLNDPNDPKNPANISPDGGGLLPTNCSNGLRDGDETAVDCGGSCKVCPGDPCATAVDCKYGCSGGKCNPPPPKTCGVGKPLFCADGQPCDIDADCTSDLCTATKCVPVDDSAHSDGRRNAGETGVDCGGTVKATLPCDKGEPCKDPSDCMGDCLPTGLCGPIGPDDRKKNNLETDVDCGGPNALPCVDGKACAVPADCASEYCLGNVCTTPTSHDGIQNGTETDIDCGGGPPTNAPRCAEGLICIEDADCEGACNYLKKCVNSPSCKPQMGGDTCGLGEMGDAWANHESCCRTLRVPGYNDPNRPGKTVYLDKYEITAGRMRAFITEMTAEHGGDPNVQDWIQNHRPPRWNNGWDNILPTLFAGTVFNYNIVTPTVDLNYPGEDQYNANHPTQSTWQVRNGNWQIDSGVYFALGGSHYFPEYLATGWPQGPDYAAGHAFNCDNNHGSYGWGTYWFDNATVAQYSGGVGKAYTQDVMDQKALNCAPFGLFAAFCAWDGGQLATAEVMDAITGNNMSPVYGAGYPNGKYAPGAQNCGGNPHSLQTYSDGASFNCWDVYYYPGLANDYDDSARIAPPGRVPADVIRINPGDEPWMDMIGNLEEAVFKAGETTRFDYRGFGQEFGSITHHRNQETTARMKGGAFGARCMRFK